jgi:hypothetical protein
MTQVQIQKMNDTEILTLTRAQTFWHYSIIPFLLIAPVMTTIDVFKYYVTHTYTSTKSIDFTFGYIWILPALIFYFIQKGRLKFRTINISVDNNTFHKTVEQTAKELEWDIEQMANQIVVAKSGFSWRSWGEQITILHNKDKILFNSICDPDNRPSVASFGMNKVNRKTFEKILKDKCA